MTEEGDDDGSPREPRPLEERLAGEDVPEHATVSRKADVSRRKATGAFYTPPALADFVVQQGGERLGGWTDGDGDQRDLRVLDPAVGAGVFLDSVIRLVDGSHLELDLVGVDIEARALAATRETLAGQDRAAAVELVEDDFFNWLWSALGEPFDLVVGNPPWGLTSSGANESPRYRDLALEFVHHGVRLLAPAGSLSVLLPGTWPFSRSDVEFRQFLLGLERDIAVYRLGEDWFEDATFTAEPVALVLGPALEDRSPRLSLFDATGDVLTPAKRYEIPVKRPGGYPGERFPTAPESFHRFLDGGDGGAPVEIATPPELGLEAYSGLKTYANREYVFDRGTAEELAADGDAEIRVELTEAEQHDGVEADRPVLIPYDKGGQTRTASGEWTAFWTPITHYVRWDADAVAYYRSKGGMRNEGTYFVEGLHFSSSGRNCPVFRLSNGLVYDADYPFIPLKGVDRWPLLSLLNSPPCMYLIEHAVNPTAHFKNQDFEDVPLPAFPEADTADLEAVGRRICEIRRAGDPVAERLYRELSYASAALYGLSETEERRAWEWFRADRLDRHISRPE